MLYVYPYHKMLLHSCRSLHRYVQQSINGSMRTQYSIFAIQYRNQSNKPTNKTNQSTQQAAQTIQPETPIGAYTTDNITAMPNRSDYINCFEYFCNVPNLSSHVRTLDSCKSYFRKSNKSTAKRHPRNKLLPPYKHKLANDDPNDTSYRIQCSIIVERLPSVMEPLHDMEGAWLALHEQRLPYTNLELPVEARTTTTNSSKTPIYIDDIDDKPDELIDIHTYDDIINNKQSLNRELREALFLLIKYKSDTTWSFPTTSWHGNSKRSGEQLNLRQTSEMILRHNIGQDISIHILGNAPIAIYKYDYSEPITAQSQLLPHAESQVYTGSKQLFFHAAYTGNNRWTPSELSNDVEQYMWVKKSDLKNYMIPELNEILDDALMV